MEYAAQQKTNLSLEIFSVQNKNLTYIENHETPLLWALTRSEKAREN